MDRRFADRILESAYRLRIPWVFAALVLISLAGIAIFVPLPLLTRLLLRHWHDSATAPDLYLIAFAATPSIPGRILR